MELHKQNHLLQEQVETYKEQVVAVYLLIEPDTNMQGELSAQSQTRERELESELERVHGELQELRTAHEGLASSISMVRHSPCSLDF